MYSGLIDSPMIFGAFHTNHLLCFRNATDCDTKTCLKTVHTRILAGIVCFSISFLDNLNSFPLNCDWTRTNIPKHTNAQNRLFVPWQNGKDLSDFAMAIKLSQHLNHVVVRYLHLSCIRTFLQINRMAMILQPAKHPRSLKAPRPQGSQKNSPRNLSLASPLKTTERCWNPCSPVRLSFQLLCLKKCETQRFQP